MSHEPNANRSERRFQHKGRPAPRAHTSWDPVANWYARWSGGEGSEYHKTLAIPTVLDLLQPADAEVIADISCGTGVLAPALPRGICYIGIDASPRLVATARRRHNQENTFVLADAARLPASPDLSAGSADAAVFMLSIQDMEPLDDVLASAAWLLKPSGRIVIFMMHPCFRIPRQSGWGWDNDRRLQYRRVDSYLTPQQVPVRPITRGRPGSIKAYHQPLEAYMNGLIKTGFRLRADESFCAHYLGTCLAFQTSQLAVTCSMRTDECEARTVAWDTHPYVFDT